MKDKKGRLSKLAREAYERVLDDGDGRVTLADVEEELLHELAAQGIADDLIEDIVQNAVAKEDKRRTQQGNSGQGDLLTGVEECLDGLWSFGDGTRVQVRYAIRRDYLRHLTLLSDNLSRQTAAHARAIGQSAKLLPYMVDETITVEQARELWRHDNPEG